MKTRAQGSQDRIDQWLTSGLNRELSPLATMSSVPAGRYRLQARPGRRRSFLAAGLAVGTFSWITAVGAFAATGSVDPAIWGQQVSRAVESCRSDLPTGAHGIGSCVSAFASRHGQDSSTGHKSAAHSTPGGKRATAAPAEPGNRAAAPGHTKVPGGPASPAARQDPANDSGNPAGHDALGNSGHSTPEGPPATHPTPGAGRGAAAPER